MFSQKLHEREDEIRDLDSELEKYKERERMAEAEKQDEVEKREIELVKSQELCIVESQPIERRQTVSSSCSA